MKQSITRYDLVKILDRIQYVHKIDERNDNTDYYIDIDRLYAELQKRS